MEIIAAVGLAQNFGAIRSLVTTGIQKGHMKMHLLNILNQLGADKNEVEKTKDYFKDKVVEHSAVVNYFKELRNISTKNKFALKSFHSNGKLLISGEYLVLDGALSLALPCKYGQSLIFNEESNGTLEWISKDVNDKIWFTAYFEAKTLQVLKTSNYNTVKWIKKS